MKDEFKPIKPEKFKKYKKGQLGSWQKFNTKTDAGNVELNTQMFNNASTPQASPNTSPVGGGMGESLIKEDTDNEYGKLNDIIDAVKKTSDKEIVDDVATGFAEGPMFVLPDGEIIGIDNYSIEGESHFDILFNIVDNIAYHKFDGKSIDDFGDYGDVVGEILDYVCNDRKWIRFNTGTTEVEERCYIVLNKERPTNAQFDAIEEFLQYGDDIGKDEVIVYIETSNINPVSKVYSYDEYLPEDIIKKIKRYYASGVLYETVEPQEQLFTEDDIKYLTEWIIDVIDLNVKKAETEIGDGRYIVYTERERDGGHVFDVIDGLNSVYIGYDTTFGKVEPIVCVMERVANSIAKNIITMIQEYDNSIIGDSTLRQIKEKCMKAIDNHFDDVLILEKVGGYNAVACEFDKNKNSLRVYSIENPTIDLYRGKLK